MRSLIIVIISFFMIMACQDDIKTEPGSSVDSLKIKTATDALISNFNIKNAPEWFLNLPDTRMIVVRGYGKSRRADMAEEKAMFDAQSRLSVAVADSSISLPVEHEVRQIAPFRVREKKRLQVDSYWHVYLLLEKAQ